MTDIDFDTTYSIYRLDADKSKLSGLDSSYSAIKHPETGNKIEGWKWGQSYWPDENIEESYEYFGAIFDATESGLSPEYFLNGIGDNEDLELLTISGEDNVHTPIINHGYYYINGQEWYLLGDGYYSQIVLHNQLMSGLQYEQLDYNPKPTIPINVKSYYWDRYLKRYEIENNFRRRVEFSGTLVSGEELSTVNDDGIIELENIDFTNPEYITLGTRDDGRTIYLNGDYSEWVGNESAFSSMEYIYSGEEVNVYHTAYSPLDTTSGLHIFVDSGTYVPEEWTMIAWDATFNGDGYKEYKVDPILGLIVFGNVWPGSGIVPLDTWQVAAAYCKSTLIEYELENGADTIHADLSVGLGDLDSQNGFLEVKN